MRLHVRAAPVCMQRTGRLEEKGVSDAYYRFFEAGAQKDFGNAHCAYQDVLAT